MKIFGILLGLLLGVVSTQATPPNILFVLSDDHSYPYLGCYGRSEMKTPSLDRMAAEGMMFRRMFTAAPQCVPSRAAIMTGRSAVACRITRFSSPLPQNEITFPEILKNEAGYFVGVCGRSYHLDGSGRAPEATLRVFEQYQMKTFSDRFDYVDASGQGRVPETMTEFFDQRPNDKPYFLWVNFSDPHHPWNTGKNAPDAEQLEVPGYLPDLPGVRKDLSDYEGEIEHCDADFQRVLDIAGERAGLENTLVFFMGDNGMAFPSGKGSLHDPGLNVPLLAWWPGVIDPGGDSSVLLSGEDIAPTCLEAAGLPVPERISGISFLPLLRGDAFSKQRTTVFAERGPHGSASFTLNTTASAVDYSRCVRTERYKLIYNVTPHQPYSPVDSARNPSWQEITEAHGDHRLATEFENLYFTTPRPVYELYDLQEDPNELHNLYGHSDYETITHELKVALQEKMIVDFDYLPLPIAPPSRSKASSQGKQDRTVTFQRLDTNADGNLTFDEFSVTRDESEAKRWFQLRDKNSDSKLDQAEYINPAAM
ncbi:sulfatase-like hydrolase/transferase [Novipirellula artificiosorum]|uniref:Arylsulfatase n=1 Tax=Novipirellula artificiosorum TaxID=2528016 RepID=A0A5C6DXL1_9BACT|nr:sulfatase-like hydrolase/transferase [Novipirellula artificiosorum]TWU40974.1 Arylsulfatase [Novipirellula artificiosorum]